MCQVEAFDQHCNGLPPRWSKWCQHRDLQPHPLTDLLNPAPPTHSQRHGIFVPVNGPLAFLGKDLIQSGVQMFVNYLPLLFIPGTGKSTGHVILHVWRHLIPERGNHIQRFSLLPEISINAQSFSFCQWCI